MALRVAIQMDHIESIKPQTDSTLLLALEAQGRGHKIWYYMPEHLSMAGDKITARANHISFFDDHKKYHELGAEEKIDLNNMDVVLLRQDPPFNMTYLTTTYILERLSPKVLVTNNPASVRNLPEKIFPVQFAQYMPPTLISADIAEIASFRDAQGEIVVKPLYGYAGRSVVHLKKGDNNFAAIMEIMFAGGKEPLMAQKFLPEVKTGDRRVIFADGKVAGAMARLPAEGEIRANFRVGGTAAKAELSAKQKEICEAIGPALKKRDIIFAGVDLIGDWLTEINITSPTGIPAMNRLYGKKIESEIWDAIEARMKKSN